MQFSFAQEKTVSGVVSDAGGTLPGANVLVKGTTRGVSTDIDGRYSIKVSVGETLVFSFIGLADQEKKVGASNTISVKLTPSATALDEVLVTGAMGIRKKRESETSSTQLVKSQELTQAANPNIAQSLIGKVSGLQINTTNNGVNPTSRIVLRGNRSITGNNEALIVIDDVVSTIGVFTALAPETVESVNVIKGAQGAALYGVNGANGVIIVTTKKGTRNEKPRISFTSSYDYQDVSFLPERQTKYGQGWNGEHVAYENGAWGAEMDGVLRPVGMLQADGTYIMSPYSPIKDNIKQFFNAGSILQNSIDFSSGGKDGSIFLSVNKQNTEFVVKDDKLDRTTFLFRANKNSGKWKMGGNVSYISTRTETTSADLYTDLLQTATNIPVGRFASPFQQYHWTSYYDSPYWLRENVRNNNRSSFINANATLSYQLNKNISFDYRPNVQLSSSNFRGYTNEYVDFLQLGGGNQTKVSAFDTNNQSARTIYADFLTNFDYELTKSIGLKALVGHNVTDSYSDFTAVGGQNLSVPGFYNISNITGEPTRSNGTTRFRGFAFFANADLNYKDYLFLNLTARNDWVSRLDKSERSLFYPSAGVSFVPTNAFDGLKDKKGLSSAKVAVNVAKVGNASSVPAYAIQNLLVQGTGYPFGSLNSFVQNTAITDPLVRPEFSVTKEVLVNLGFLNDRITLDGSFYRSDNKDLITNQSTSLATGVSSSRANIGKTVTDGFEIDLGFSSKQDATVKWNARFSYATNKTIVKAVTADQDEVSLQGNADVGIFATVGEEFPLIKGTAYQRDENGAVIIDAANGNPLQTAAFKILGRATPDYILGFNGSVEYKGIRLAGVFDFRTGHQFWAGNKDWLSWSGHLVESAQNGRRGFVFPNSVVTTATPGVYAPNTGTITGGTTYVDYLNYFSNEYRDVSENFVLDATAFKCRELTLSYSLPTSILSEIGLSSVTLGAYARNLFVILPKENRGYHDPEFANTSGNAAGLATTDQYPPTRTFGFSLNVIF
jgi:TonB-linked SusC/RagA family outer membrane protein